MNKGERRSKVKKVDMSIVKKLLCWCKLKKDELEGTKYTCNLRPKKGSEPCISCEYYEDCAHYEWEREFIHKQDIALKDSKRREKRCSNKSSKTLEEDVGEENYPDYEEDTETMYDDEAEYPCKEFSFACSNKSECNNGKYCPWIN